MKHLAALAAIFLFAAGCTLSNPQLGEFGSAHAHADFKVYVNGAAYNFSQEKYMTPELPGGEGENCGYTPGSLAHLHHMDGNLAHIHATGVTWGYFFSTLNMSMDGSCFRLDTGESHCNGGGKRWRFFVNGTEVQQLYGREIQNADRALFTYGADDAITPAQMASVTSEASNESEEQICK